MGYQSRVSPYRYMYYFYLSIFFKDSSFGSQSEKLLVWSFDFLYLFETQTVNRFSFYYSWFTVSFLWTPSIELSLGNQSKF